MHPTSTTADSESTNATALKCRDRPGRRRARPRARRPGSHTSVDAGRLAALATGLSPTATRPGAARTDRPQWSSAAAPTVWLSSFVIMGGDEARPTRDGILNDPA